MSHFMRHDRLSVCVIIDITIQYPYAYLGKLGKTSFHQETDGIEKSMFELEDEVCVTDTLDEYLGHTFLTYV